MVYMNHSFLIHSFADGHLGQTFEALDRAHVLEFVVLTYSEEAR